MSGALIALLHASGEAPAVLPFGTREGLGASEADSTAIDSSEADNTQADAAEVRAIGRPIADDPTPADHQTPSLGETAAAGSNPDLWLYRDRTVALLRRYMRLSIEVGRMPSLLGREFFRTRVTSYRAGTFEDSVIFVHDVERSLEKLSEFDKQLIAKVVLQEYSQEEAGRLMGCGRRHAVRCFADALDRVTEIFLKRDLLTRLPCTKTEAKKSCQGGKNDEFPASDSQQTKNKS